MLDQEIIEIAKNIYETEIKSLELRMNKLSENFVKVVRKIYDCKGKVVVTGIGKTGIIGKKISATFCFNRYNKYIYEFNRRITWRFRNY